MPDHSADVLSILLLIVPVPVTAPPFLGPAANRIAPTYRPSARPCSGLSLLERRSFVGEVSVSAFGDYDHRDLKRLRPSNRENLNTGGDVWHGSTI